MNRRTALKTIGALGLATSLPVFGNNSQAVVETENTLLVKWAKLLEGIDEDNKVNWAILFENQDNFNRKGFYNRYATISLPVIRNLYNMVSHRLFNMSAKEFPVVSVREYPSLNKKLNVNKKLKITPTFNWLNFQVSPKNYKEWEAEIIAITSCFLGLEFDRENISNVMKGVNVKTNFDFAYSIGDTINEKYEKLYEKIVETDNILVNKNVQSCHRVGCTFCRTNWMVTGPEIASIFETASCGFEPTSSCTHSLGINCVGTINNRWKLYKDPLFPVNKILIGRKQGYTFSPHLIFADYTNNITSNYFGLLSNPNCYGIIEIGNFL